MISEALQRPIGPLAAWQWGLVIGGGYLGYRVLTGQGLFPSGGGSASGVTTGGAAIGDPGFNSGGSQGPVGATGATGATGAPGASGGLNTTGVCAPGYKAIALGKSASGQTYYGCVPVLTSNPVTGKIPSGIPTSLPPPSTTTPVPSGKVPLVAPHGTTPISNPLPAPIGSTPYSQPPVFVIHSPSTPRV